MLFVFVIFENYFYMQNNKHPILLIVVNKRSLVVSSAGFATRELEFDSREGLFRGG